jgi:integrase
MVSEAPSKLPGTKIRPNHVPFEVEAPELPSLVHVYLKERFARASQLAIRADWRVWKGWCDAQQPKRLVFPATAPDLREFIASCSPPVDVDSRGTAAMKLDVPAAPNVKAATTLTRYLNSIGVVHRLAGLADPTKDPLVASARRMVTRGRRSSAQKSPLGLTLILRMVDCLAEPTLWNLRTRALLLVAHSTMARRAELVALCVEDLASAAGGDGVATLRRSKTDQDGQGSDRYLSAIAVTAVRDWLEAGRITEGPVFRRLGVGGSIAPTPITAHEVARGFKAAYARLLKTLPDEERRRLEPIGQDIAAHSTRIGAAQDLVASGADLVAVMQAGGWEDTSMPALYTRRLNALRGGMAQLYRDRRSSESAICTSSPNDPRGFLDQWATD